MLATLGSPQAGSEEVENLFIANAVNEEDSERDRATQGRERARERESEREGASGAKGKLKERVKERGARVKEKEKEKAEERRGQSSCELPWRRRRPAARGVRHTARLDILLPLPCPQKTPGLAGGRRRRQWMCVFVSLCMSNG